MVLGFISASVGAIVLLIGVALMFFPKLRTVWRSLPVVGRLDSKMAGIVMIALGLFAGGFGVVSGYVSSGSLLGGDEEMGATVGGLDLTISNGISNATTTEDYYNDEETFLTFYSADANIADGEEYKFNITIERELASEDAVITVSCNAPDKEISGVTADSLVEKTAGQIDLDIDDGGRHVDDNTVEKRYGFSEGTVSDTVEVAFDHEETYHDGMSDLDDYFDVVCSVSGDDGSSASVTTRVYADS